MVRCILDS
jgi:hypothetical protein